jgi:hypothetical protein
MALVVATGALGLIGCVRTRESAPPIFPELTPYKVQMHLHGHSNHNGGERPASMEWHSTEAANNAAADVLWWSDHAGVFDLTWDIAVDFSQGTLHPETLDLTDLASPKNITAVTWLDSEQFGGSPAVSHDPDGLRVELTADPGDAWQRLRYLLKSNHISGLVKGFRLPRPISSGAKLEVHIEGVDPGADSYISVEVWLSWHHIPQPVQQRIEYRIVPNSTEFGRALLSEDTLLIFVPYSPSGIYSFDLLDAAQNFKDGDDNTVQQIALGVASRKGSTISATFVDLRLSSTHPKALHQLKMMRRFATRYEARLNLREHLGLEFAGGSGTHLNAFIDEDLSSLASLATEFRIGQVDTWVNEVHALDGLVSLNHPFGTNSGTGNLLDEGERRLVLAETADELVGNRAYGADLLEAGYLARGGLDLQDHLDLWDILTAQRIFLTGTGVNDSHGGFWSGEMRPNPFVTWVYSPSTETSDLLAALEAGAAFFGNPFYWGGRFAFRVGPFLMGEHGSTGDDRLALDWILLRTR